MDADDWLPWIRVIDIGLSISLKIEHFRFWGKPGASPWYVVSRGEGDARRGSNRARRKHLGGRHSWLDGAVGFNPEPLAERLFGLLPILWTPS
ncbi:hypothetical protein [Methylocystis echinoides]|uniref:hypothetical protein n=1 Tax=Methylocystis echinoides TaxID=29468 RepID=UPI0024930CC8|nr:hypothetical protein [Methylocystis echinoides]